MRALWQNLQRDPDVLPALWRSCCPVEQSTLNRNSESYQLDPKLDQCHNISGGEPGRPHLQIELVERVFNQSTLT